MIAPSPEQFRRAMSLVPTAVTIVTAKGEQGPAGATANAVGSLSLDPPLMLACLDRGSRTLRAVEQAGRFAVNVLAEDQATVARSFSSKAPVAEKWTGISWRQRFGVPVLEGVVVWVACELQDVLAGGDHAIVTGAVLEFERRGSRPLVFHRGEYRPLG